MAEIKETVKYHKCEACSKSFVSLCLYRPAKDSSMKHKRICLQCLLEAVGLGSVSVDMAALHSEIDRQRVNIFSHRQLYYKYDAPILQDWVYDKIEKQLITLEDTAGYINECSPRCSVGDELPERIASKVQQSLSAYFEIQERYKALREKMIRVSLNEQRRKT